jgi:hypothetical protein
VCPPSGSHGCTSAPSSWPSKPALETRAKHVIACGSSGTEDGNNVVKADFGAQRDAVV